MNGKGGTRREPRLMKHSTRNHRVHVEREDQLQFLSLRTMEVLNNSVIRKVTKIVSCLSQISVQHLNPEGHDYFVIGVVGGPGVGKSSLLNQILEFSRADQTRPMPPFKEATAETIIKGVHTTRAIDFRVNGRRLIALDTPPVASPSVLMEFLSCSSPSMELARGLSVAALRGSRPPKASAEALYKIMSVQTATFLLCVCHVVLFVFDGPHDDAMFELLEAAELFAVNIHSSALDGIKLAYALLVCANLQAAEMTPNSVEKLRSTFNQKTAVSRVCRHRVLRQWPGQSGPASALGDEGMAGSFDEDARALSFLALPKTSTQGPLHPQALRQSAVNPSTTAPMLYPLLQTLVEDLKRQLLTLKYRKQNELNEVTWFKHCQSVWESIWKSKSIAEYYFALQDTLYRDGGGW